MLGSLLGQQFGGKRQLYDVLGYKHSPGFDDYMAYYQREGMAKRIIDAPANATWRHIPEIIEGEEEPKVTTFEQAWKDIAERLSIWHRFPRVDRLARIGQYAVLLIGTKGNLEEPVEKARAADVLYLTPYSEKHAPIDSWVDDTADPRFGLPLFYNLTTTSSNRNAKRETKVKVHHSRILHVAEDRLEDEVLGTPALEAVLNRLYDLEKVAGAAPEQFWLEVSRLVLGIKEGFSDWSVKDDPTAQKNMREQLDDLTHKLRNFIVLEGYEMQKQAGKDVNPGPTFDMIMALISGTTGIPKRILTGSEQGELASSQDETNWNARIQERRISHAEPNILRPFLDRLLLWGALPKPTDPYRVEWPSLFEMDDKDKAQVWLNVATAMEKLETVTLIAESEKRAMFEFPEDRPDDPEEEPIDEEDPAVQDQFARGKRK